VGRLARPRPTARGFAYAFGVAIQYFTIAPMRQRSVGKGLWAAVKADTLSLTAWQVGMYRWMAVPVFLSSAANWRRPTRSSGS